MSKPTKPQWATNNPLQVIEPNLAKKQTGWLPGEKPPNQFFNWLLLKTYAWINWTESKTENIEPVLFRSNSPVGWDGATLTFPAPIDLIFRVVTGPSQINRFLAGNLAFADGEALVLKRDKTGPSPVTVVAGAYGALTPGQYAIIPEANLTGADVENEMIVFRRRGAELEIPYLGVILPVDASYHIGISDDHGILEGLGDDDHPQYLHLNKAAQTILKGVGVAVGETIDGIDLDLHNHEGGPKQGVKLDHGAALNGLGDDDHPQYSRADGTRAFTGKVQGVTPGGGDPATTIATKGYVDSSVITDHGALGGLGDDDHPQYAHLNKGGQAFLQKVTHPSTGGGDPGTMIATKDYVDGEVISDHGSLGGLGDDDHPQYLHLNKGGQTLNQNLAVAGGVTIDGVNINVHTHNGSVGLSVIRNSHAFYDNNNSQDLTDTEAGFDASDMAWCSVSNLSLNSNNFSSDNYIRIGSTVIQQLSGFDFNHQPNFSGGLWNFRQMTSAGNDNQVVVFCRGVIANDDTFTTGVPN